ncbi:hypothetical protein [Cimodo virus]|uniref:hypothetical protein n=1 Tax=Cimodo virus TaxID=1427476 RepID=UPI0003E771C8|nr:hypothetical protein [Cimodo virus]AHF20709.1 hypothetical protein [Cimodo virus]
MSYLITSAVSVEASPIWTQSFSQFLDFFSVGDTSIKYDSPDYSTVAYPPLLCRSNEESHPPGNYFEMIFDTKSLSVSLNYSFYDEDANTLTPYKLSRDTFVRMFDRRAKPTVLMDFMTFTGFIDRDNMYGLSPFIVEIVTKEKLAEMITNWSNSSIEQKFLEIGMTQPRLDRLKANHDQVSVLYISAPQQTIDVPSETRAWYIHLSQNGAYCGYRSPDDSMLNCFYGWSLNSSGVENTSRYLSGALGTGVDPKLRKALGTLPFDKTIVQLINDSAGAKYDPSKHDNQELDDYLINQKTITTDQQAQITTINDSIPASELVGRTILQIVQETGQQILASAKLYTDEQLLPVVTKLNSDIEAMNAKITDVQTTLQAQITTNKDGLAAEISARVSEAEQFRSDISRLTSSVNSLSRKVDQIADVDLEELSRKIREIEEILNRDFPSLENLLAGFNLMIEKMFATGKITRRQGFYEVPSIGLFEKPSIVISNEGVVYAVGLSEKFVLQRNLPRLLVENYTFNISFTPAQDGWCVFISDAPPPTVQGADTFVTAIGYITYERFLVGVPFQKENVIYVTYGKRVYL